MITHIQLAFILLAAPTALSRTDYCALKSCPNESHTLCRYPEFDVAENCGLSVQLALSIEEQNEIYNKHIRLKLIAEYRRQKGLGRNPYRRSLTNRDYSLEWDEELVSAAQTWANQCIDRTDQCRNVERFSVDQRVGRREITNGRVWPAMSTIIQDWFNEGPFTQFDRESLIASGNTRSIWESATKIGCGAVRAYNGTRMELYFVCNYAPVDFEEYAVRESCGSNIRIELSGEELKEIYKTHIRLKQRIEARRLEISGRISNLRDSNYLLEWNEELKKSAQTWANQCANRIDQCRNNERFCVHQRVGVTVVFDSIFQPSFTNLIEDWYYEDPLTVLERYLPHFLSYHNNMFTRAIRREHATAIIE